MIQKCFCPWDRFTINKYEFYNCCRADYNSKTGKHYEIKNNIGEYKKGILHQIWNSDLMQSIRISMSQKGIIPTCFLFENEQLTPTRCTPNEKFYTYIPNRFIQSHQKDNIKKMQENFINQKSIVDHYPVYISLLIDYFCNSRCIMCPQQKNYKDGDLWIVPIKKIEDDLIEFLHYAVALILVGGEPTISPNYNLIIDIIRRANGAKIHLITNGQLIEREVIPNLDIMGYFHISADASTPETYSKIRKGLDFNRLVNGVKKLIKVKEDRNIMIYNIINKYNYKEMPHMAKFWYDIGVERVCFEEVSSRSTETNPLKFCTQNDIDDLKKYIEETENIVQQYQKKSTYIFPITNCLK